MVTSGEKMALYAAANIALAIENFKNRGYASFGGVILNARNVEREVELVEEFARDADSQIVKILPRSSWVQRAEEQHKTVVEAFPESDMAEEYRELADRVLQICQMEEN